MHTGKKQRAVNSAKRRTLFEHKFISRARVRRFDVLFRTFFRGALFCFGELQPKVDMLSLFSHAHLPAVPAIQ